MHTHQLDTGAPSNGDIASQTRRLYFAYGSNLSPTQMSARCPEASAVGLGRLDGWRWLINERGYANIVSVTTDPITTDATPSESSIVYGLLYTLNPADEAALDRCEGVPWAYQKVHLDVEMVTKDDSEGVTAVEALVYVDHTNVEPGQPRAEYVGRMNKGIREAAEGWGLDEEYVRTVLRKFIPAPGGL